MRWRMLLVVAALEGCDGGDDVEHASRDAGDDASLSGTNRDGPHYWRCECDVQGSGTNVLKLTHAAGSPVYADTCDTSDPSERLESEGEYFAAAKGDQYSCECEPTSDKTECSPCGPSTHCETQKTYEEKGLTLWPPMVSGVLWDARCYRIVDGERYESGLREGDACSALPEGPGAFLDWYCNGRLALNAPLPDGYQCECEASLPEQPRSCTTCSEESECGMRAPGEPWYSEVP